ncbi:unnamed protein product [Orchesella dallaii]|uniref:Citron Rho-interacting kinase n=1 Tax=Orchesella dallaii TaxID=48710 RepID=A0ABP1QZW5_9HEXA
MGDGDRNPIDAVARSLQNDIFGLGRATELNVRRSVTLVESQIAKNTEDMEIHIKDINERHKKNIETKINHYEARIKDMEEQLQERSNKIDQLKGRLEESRAAKKEALVELEQCRQQHKERIEELKDCINESKEKLTLLEKERERRKSEVCELSNIQVMLDETKEAKKKLEDKVVELENELTDNRFKLNQLEAEKQRLETRMESFETQNQLLTSELDKIMETSKNKVETEDSVRKVLEDQLEKIQKDWDATKKLLYLEEVRTKDLEKQVSELHRNNGLLKVDVRIETRNKNDLQVALDKERQKNQSLLEKIGTSDKDTCTLGSKLSSLEFELQLLKKELEAKAQNIINLSAAQELLTEQKLQLKNENVTLKNELAIFQLKAQENQHLSLVILDKDTIIQEKENLIDMKNREVKKLKNNNEDLKNVLKVLDEQQQEFTVQLEKQLSSAKELEHVNQILQKENNDLREQLTLCRRELNESKSLKAFTEQRLKTTETENQSIELRVQHQLSFLTSNNEELANCNASLTNRMNKAEAENVQLNTTIAAYIKDKEQLATETKQLTNIVIQIKEENITLKSALKETLGKAETFKEDYEKCQEICRIQEQEMTRMKVQLSTKVDQQEKLIDYLREQLEKFEKKKKKGILFTPKRQEKETFTPSKTGTPLTKPVVNSVRENLTSAKCTPVSRKTPTLPPPKKEECVLLQEKCKTIGAGYKKSDDGKMHKFSGTRCERTEMCMGCPEPIYRGMSSLLCEDCNLSTHPTCATTVGKSCGKVESAISDIEQCRKMLSCSSEDQLVKGSVNIRTNLMAEAGLRHLKIKNCTLMVYTSDSFAGAPLESFPLNEETTIYFSPPDVDNMKKSSKKERACTMKLEVVGLDHKPKFMYMFHQERNEMRYWIRGIERNKKTRDMTPPVAFNLSSSDEEKENRVSRFSEKLLFDDRRQKKLYVNSIYWLEASKAYLLGCDDGLYSLKQIGGNPVKIEGPQAIYQIDILHGVKYAVFIEGPLRTLTTVYLGLLKTCAEAAECSNPKFTSEVVPRTKDCYLLATRSKSSKDTFVAAASKTSLLLCSWTEAGLALVKQEVMKECITALLMTEHSVLCGNQTVLEIDTKTFQVEDFLDMTDESIYYVQIVNESHGSYPVAILDVTQSRGPEADENEFLICFQDIGIFVDSFGRRSRAEDVLWSRVPLSFEYRHPYLYIFHFESVEVQLLNEKSYTREPVVTRVVSKVGDKSTTKKVAKYRKHLPEVHLNPVTSKSSPTYVGKGSSEKGVVYYLNGVHSSKMIELSSSFST